MKKLKRSSQSLLSFILSFHLAFPYSVMAEESNRTQYKKSGFSNAMGTLGSLANTGLSLYQQAQQRSALAAQQEKVNLALSPTTFENNYFPGCQTLPAMSAEVAGLCQGTPQSAQEAQMFASFADKSGANRVEYATYSKESGNKQGINHGIPCVNERIDQINDMLTQREVSLGEILSKVNDEKKKLDQALKPQKDAIAELHGYLHGGNGLESNNTRKYSALFRQVASDKNCGSFMDNLQVQDYAQKGIKNIESSVNKVRRGSDGTDLVTHLIRNQGNIQQTIRKFADDVSRNITKKGMEESVASFGKGETTIPLGMGLSGSPAISNILKKQATFQDEEFSDLRSKFDKIGQKSLYETIFQEGEHNFTTKLEVWRNKQQNECLARKISTSSDKPFEEFTRRIDHSSDKIRSKANIQSLQTELISVLGNERLSIEEKVRKVRETIGSDRVEIMSYDTLGGTTDQKGWNPADLLSQYASTCLTEYKNIRMNGEGQSFAQIENEARAIHAEYKKLEREFPAKVSRSIYDKMINCKEDGAPIPYSVSSMSCNQDKLSIASENFCLGQSVECAKNINLCSEKIEKTIVTITKTLGDVAKVHNTLVTSFVNAQNSTLTSLKQQSLVQSKQLENLFAKSKFFVPIDMNIPDPEKVFQMKGVNGNLDVSLYETDKMMEEFTAKMTELQSKVREQNQKILKEVEEEKKNIAKNYSDEAKKWSELERLCAEGVNAFNIADAERANKEDEKNAKTQQELADFCYDFASYKRAPGCDESLDDLEDSARKVAMYIDTGEVTDAIGGVKAICLKTNYEEKGGGSAQTAAQYAQNQKDCEAQFKDITDATKKSQEVDKCVSVISSAGRSVAGGMSEDNLKQTTALVGRAVIPACEAISNTGFGFDNIASSVSTLGGYATEFMSRQ